MFTAPFQGWRRVSVRQRRTAVDWAEEVKYLLDEVYPDAVRVTLPRDTSFRDTGLARASYAIEALDPVGAVLRRTLPNAICIPNRN